MSSRTKLDNPKLTWTAQRGMPRRLSLLFDALAEINPKDTRSELAKVMGLTKGNLSNWTRIKNPGAPGLQPLVLLCERFNLSMDYLIWGHGRTEMDSRVLAVIDRLEHKRPSTAA